MNANVLGGLTPRKRPRARAVAALLPGVFALLFAGVSGVGGPLDPRRNADGVSITNADPEDLPGPRHQSGRHVLPAPEPLRHAASVADTDPHRDADADRNAHSHVGWRDVQRRQRQQHTDPEAHRDPCSDVEARRLFRLSGSSGASGGTHSGGHGTTGAAGSTGAPRVQVPADPSPFGALGTVAALSTGGLDAARIPPVEALTPLSGLDFGTGLNVGPLLLLIDMIGIGLLVYLVRTRWLAPEA